MEYILLSFNYKHIYSTYCIFITLSVALVLLISWMCDRILVLFNDMIRSVTHTHKHKTKSYKLGP